MFPIPDDEEWLKCSQCGVEYYAADIDEADREAYEEFDDDEGEATRESYGRHRTRLRESDE